MPMPSGGIASHSRQRAGRRLPGPPRHRRPPLHRRSHLALRPRYVRL